ncbi:Carboxypeptidase Y [Neolecta irregularis DAH-3]|uniref:Carboxypeptidase n=1 Tax=Neolecta irregularis (strain DAH-3) TaxID=1198029 RepID=A0A1U7LQ63_NEOID|nr:Carboxypeptidase Y [Neolecta irregularis DAH-3]|eukprot:OLL24784.1 Carboxypeptidase Y [Neolecta irregularis DAH-3]
MAICNIRASSIAILTLLLGFAVAEQAVFNNHIHHSTVLGEFKQSDRKVESHNDQLRKDDEPSFESFESSPLQGENGKPNGGDWDFIFTSSVFPNHHLRVKSPLELGVDSYSGYITVDESKNFFFWFFESRREPATDPLILWLNGGPGCSSLFGLFEELGPSRINEDGINLDYNKYSWNNNANLMFLDQPLGTGFSYGNVNVSSTTAAAKDVFAFLTLFLQNFPKYSNRDFYIAGESYAGHYIPAIAKAILEHTKGNSKEFYSVASQTEVDAIPKINLKSILIGNGYVNPLIQYLKYPEMACDNRYGPVLTEYDCTYMRTLYPMCADLIRKCDSTGSQLSCAFAENFCDSLMFSPIEDAGIDVYDVRHLCPSTDTTPCYPLDAAMEKYLNQPSVMKAIGAEVEKFKACNAQVDDQFFITGDMMKTYVDEIPVLLEQGMPILIYAGEADYICNWKGCLAWVESLEWSGSLEFSSTSFSKFGGEKNWGLVKSYANLTFLIIHDSGHFVPLNAPEAASVMIDQWISGNYNLDPILP